MGKANKSATFEFLKDFRTDAKKGEKLTGYYADDWKDVEFRRMNSLGMVSKTFWVPMTEVDKTIKKVTAKKQEVKPKPKDKPTPDTKPTSETGTTPPVVEEKKSVLTTKNILIGVGVLVVLFVGYKMATKKGK
jgi:hypothetical protein